MIDEVEYSRAWSHFTDGRNTMIQIGNNKFAEHGSIERMVEEKLETAEAIFQRLATKCSDHVLEIGSGLGIHTAFFAERTSRVYTVDVSDGFGKYFERFCGDRQNVTRILDPFFPMLSAIEDAALDCGFATAVFCHLHVYDIALYFEELKRKLKPGARFYVNFQNSDNFELTNLFTRYLENYRSGGRFVPIQPGQMQFHSREFFRAVGMKHDCWLPTKGRWAAIQRCFSGETCEHGVRRALRLSRRPLPRRRGCGVERGTEHPRPLDGI